MPICDTLTIQQMLERADSLSQHGDQDEDISTSDFNAVKERAAIYYVGAAILRKTDRTNELLRKILKELKEANLGDD